MSEREREKARKGRGRGRERQRDRGRGRGRGGRKTHLDDHANFRFQTSTVEVNDVRGTNSTRKNNRKKQHASQKQTQHMTLSDICVICKRCRQESQRAVVVIVVVVILTS